MAYAALSVVERRSLYDMAHYILEVAFQPKDGLPKDQMENVWHFSSASGAASAATLSEAQAAATLVETFYTAIASGAGRSVAGYYSQMLSEAAIINVYDEAAANPRPEFFHTSFPIAPSSEAQGMPEQVALCMSYYAVRNIARHRGRLYLGPFSSEADNATDPSDTPGGSRPAANLIQAICSSAEALLAAETTVVWCVRSGLGSGSVAAPQVTYYPVTDGWVDNEWDIQRRRRIEATSRLAFTATGTG